MKHLTVFIPVIGGALFVFVVISLLRTSFTDPGILPRATLDEAADLERQIGETLVCNYTLSGGHTRGRSFAIWTTRCLLWKCRLRSKLLNLC